MRTKSVRRSVEEKRQLLARFESSDQTQRAYAARVGIGLSTLGLWLRQLGRDGAARLVEVEVTGGAGRDPSPSRYRVELPGRACLEVERGFDAVELRTLVRILKEEI